MRIEGSVLQIFIDLSLQTGFMFRVVHSLYRTLRELSHNLYEFVTEILHDEEGLSKVITAGLGGLRVA
jgi:hypothetical protein